MRAKWSLVLPKYRSIENTRRCELLNNSVQLFQQIFISGGKQEFQCKYIVYESSSNHFSPIEYKTNKKKQ